MSSPLGSNENPAGGRYEWKGLHMTDAILDQAERLFFAHGFQATTLSGICAPLKIKPASLYYHFRGGKEEIYVQVIRRRTSQFRAGIEDMAHRHHDLSTILKEFGYWYVEQPPMNMMLIAQMDMPNLSRRAKDAVNYCVRSSVFEPLGQVFINHKTLLKTQFDPFTMVGTLSVLLFSIHTAAAKSGISARHLVDYNIEVFLRGVMAGTT
jgi:AcrR family transcriptional regulator